MRPRLRRGGWIAPALCLGLLLSACEVSVRGGRELDTGSIESQIETGIEEQTDVTVESVQCPDDVLAEAGDTFECTVTDEGGDTATVKVTQVNDEGRVRWRLQT